MSDDQDLTESLAAAEAVRARRGASEAGGADALRGITLEIEMANKGEVLDVASYLEWRQTARRRR